MKKYLLLIGSVILLAACSSPKYAYYFDYYDYNSGKAKADLEAIVAKNTMVKPETSPLYLNNEAAMANAERRIRNVEKISVDVAPTITQEDKAAFKKEYLAMSKDEKKEFRKELKSVVKQIIKAKKAGDSIESVEAVNAMERDLKMALIFGIVAIVLGAFGGANPVFWILGTVAAVIALVFLIMWIAEQ